MTMLRMIMSNARISIFTIRDVISIISIIIHRITMILFLLSTLDVLGDDANVRHMSYTKE